MAFGCIAVANRLAVDHADLPITDQITNLRYSATDASALGTRPA